MGLVGKLLAIVGRAVARLRPAEVRVDVSLTPEERAVAQRVPSAEEAAQAHEWATEGPLPPGWNRPKPETSPAPTYWPFLLALGATFVAWGLISNLFVFFGGLLLFLVAAAGWIGDLLNEFA
jgi:hypothetical protein